MKVFRDPIYTLISFRKKEDKSILEIIDTPEFQRLRRIRQLGFSCYTYPTATHDRFSHSLGVAFVIGQLFDSLDRKGQVPDRTTLSTRQGDPVDLDKDQLKLLVQLAGLLHDIGHGPFSHAFEKITSIDHEKRSMEIILNENGRILPILRQIEIDNEAVKTNFPYWITQIIGGGAFHPFWIKELLSSQLDADRIDYLLRDAYMCGVKYASFDMKWLFQNIEIGKIRDNDNERLIVNADKGLHAVEAFIVSRYHMYEQVYFHKTTRGLEAVIQQLFQQVKLLCLPEKGKPKMKEADFILPEIYHLLTKDPLPVDEYLALDDYCIYTQLRFWKERAKDGIIHDLCSTIIDRKPYKLIREGTDNFTREEHAKIEKFFTFGQNKNKRDSHLLEDDYTNTPYKDSFILGNKGADNADQIWVRKNGKQDPAELTTVSPIIDALKNRELKRKRVYAHRDCSTELMEILK